MHLSRGLLAGVLALAASVAITGCVSSDGAGQISGTGGAPGTGGTGEADAASDGSGTSGDGASAGGSGGERYVASSYPYKNCGNNVVDKDEGEQCDDGNRLNDDGCDSDCRYTCEKGPVGDALCAGRDGNFCNGQEICGSDHKCHPSAGNLPDLTICGQGSTCQGGKCKPAGEHCGDRLVVGSEECDPPDGAGCGPDCRFACVATDPARDCHSDDICAGTSSCQTTHTCSPRTHLADFQTCGPAGSTISQPGFKSCIDGVCTHCGDKVVDPGEECDDGNSELGDGCDKCKFSCDANDPTRDCHATDECYVDGVCGPKHKCSAPAPQPNGHLCGAGKKNCVAGVCTAPVCGDGIQAVGLEQCDDGNLASGDGCENNCQASCTKAADCAGSAPPCNKGQCSNNRCTFLADSTVNGNPCSNGAASASCNDGACTLGTCGDGVVDTGEQCDLGTASNGPSTGCEKNCVFSCQSDADCNDGDPCNGTEKCTAVTQNSTTIARKCATAPGTALADQAVCGPASPRRICMNGGCARSICGDGYWDQGAGEECDPPSVGCSSTCKAVEVCDLTGAWAIKTTLSVSWGDDLTLATMGGDIHQWALLTTTQAKGSLNFTTTIRSCELDIPDFQSGSGTGSEWYGITFPNTIWDGSTTAFNATGHVSNPSPGASVTVDQAAILMGLDMDQPLGDWPSWTDLNTGVGAHLLDIDNDGNPGLTSPGKTGPLPPGYAPTYDGVMEYDYPFVNIDSWPDLTNSPRAKALYLAIRSRTSQAGRLTTCDDMSGATNVLSIDNHVMGCLLTDGTPCDPIKHARDFVDQIKPLYSPKSGSFIGKRLSGTPSCQAVRDAIP